MRVRPLLFVLCGLMVFAMLEATGCADSCEEAKDHCLQCDVEKSTCAQRFDAASSDECARAVDAYRAGGCDPYANQQLCSGDTEPPPPTVE